MGNPPNQRVFYCSLNAKIPPTLYLAGYSVGGKRITQSIQRAIHLFLSKIITGIIYSMNEDAMTTDSNVPKWAMDYINEWRDILYLYEWRLRVNLSPHPDEDASGCTKASVRVWPAVLIAEIEIRDDIPDAPDAEWQKTLIHELLHIRWGRATDMVDNDFLPQLSPGARDIAEKAFEREIEPVIEIMAHVLHGLKHGRG